MERVGHALLHKNYSLGAVVSLEVIIIAFSLPRQSKETIEGSFLQMYPSQTHFKKSLSESCIRVITVSDPRYSDSGKTTIRTMRFPLLNFDVEGVS